MDRLTSIRVFVETVDRGTISAAANALDMSRAMATRYLEHLEEWLGVRLLHRTTRKLSLSEAGEKFLKNFREMLVLTEDIVLQAAQGGEVQGKLRVTSTPSFTQAQLMTAIVDFQAHYPKVEIEMMMLDGTVDLVEDRIDLAIRLSNRIEEGLIARHLAVCHSVICASPAYLTRMGKPQTPQDLTTHHAIIHSTRYSSFDLWLGEQLTTVAVSSKLTANETSIVLAGALAGAGIAMLPTYYIGKELANGELEVLLPQYQLEPLNIQAIYLSRRHQPLALRLLIDFLAERFGGDIAPWDMKHLN
ncbi:MULTISPECIES: LysR family transcriptional regulator [Acinetobacter calcoaceticus/baumannii complex]|uniref:LysR family transcriptional regulator n=1 Tax=Acinetobacter calcoaceticus/baumannii complex TaxID=909768 RepID=UPI0002D07F6E|nr:MULTISPECIES: LysR family transcriptional regulator [Acinetobacter calcoaceticus/baumannii complex]ENW51777.1 hypothetical protein F917_01610 [Acinetobacter baumannii NIPH 67]MCL6175893.1 LysR family transcriptional regulator [Acinetobacter baumannii]MCL6179169.1 LysR family transcriptional regulator [Acinetobacter baumannii]MCL6186078.1 LysR family transcriptional regulator [Acinetobacter baumannii]MCL6206795.1 LysR family transcriptional regulator [Acinetobacter baumannii]